MTVTVTVFGATGGVGSQVVDQLRSRGHTVTAYVRNPSKVPSTWGEDVTKPVPEGDRAAAGRGHPQHRGRDAAARCTPLRRQRHP